MVNEMLAGLLIMSLWMNDAGASFNRMSGSAPAYLSRGESVRWERLRMLKLLYCGDHRRYFLDEGRTQFNFPPEEIEGRLVQRYITYNLCRQICHTTADLMFGAEVKLDATTPQQKARLDRLESSSLLHARLHEAAVQMSWAGGAFLEATVWRGEPYIEVLPAADVYPQGRRGADGQYLAYTRYASDTITEGDRQVPVLLRTTYLPGVVHRELRRIDARGGLGEQLDLAMWPAFGGGAEPPPLSEQATGLDRPSVVYIPNKVGDCEEVSDFDGLIELQDGVNAKYAQFARVVAQHADPKTWFPETAADPSGNVKATHNAFFGGIKPEYIVWNPQLDAADKDRAAYVLAFCTAAEMSPVLLGIRQGGTPDAARKLRLEATKDLAKTARKTLVVKPAIALAIDLAQRLDQRTPYLRSYPIDPVGVHMRDGLPVDGLDLATEASIWRSAGLMSVEGGVGLRIEDPDAAAVEVARLREEKSAAIPSVLLQEPGEAREVIDTADELHGDQATEAA